MSRQVKKVNISGKEDKSNKVTSWSNTTTDTNYPSEKLVKDSLDGKANSTHNHTKSQITDFPTSMTPTSHTHGNLQNNGQVGSTAQANKNVVTDSSGKITTEDKPTIPSASSTTPSADTTSGSYGSGTSYARSNHTHPKSSLYAEASHNHTKSQITDFPTIPSKTSDLTNDSGFLTSHQDISGKEDKSNKVSSWSNTPTDTHYPSEKLVKDSLDLKSDSTHIHTIDLNSFDFYDADNWRTIDGNAPTISSNSIQANAVSHHILNKEFLESKYYTLTFEFNTASSRNGLYLFGDMECNHKFGIVTDVGNTFVEQYDANGNATRLYDGTKNYFTGGWHDIKVIRKGATATLYIDDELYYTFNNIGNSTNIFGLFKWSSGSVTIRNVDVSLDVTELPIDDYVGRDELDDYVEKNNLKTIEGVNLVGNENVIIDVSCSEDSTIIFEDECGSSVNIGEYGAVKSIYGSTTTGTMEYDSTYNAYALNWTGTSSNSDATIMFPITSLTGLDNFTIEADIQSQHIAYNRIGFGCVDSDGNTAFFTIGHDAWSSALRFFYGNHSSITAIADDESFTQQWYHIVVNVQGNSYLADLYLSDTKIASVNGSYSLDISTRDVGIMLGCPSNSTCWVKNINIKVESLGGDSENTIYLGDDIMTMIDTALGHIVTNWEDYE